MRDIQFIAVPDTPRVSLWRELVELACIGLFIAGIFVVASAVGGA